MGRLKKAAEIEAIRSMREKLGVRWRHGVEKSEDVVIEVEMGGSLGGVQATQNQGSQSVLKKKPRSCSEIPLNSNKKT